jgi:rubrerythrin
MAPAPCPKRIADSSSSQQSEDVAMAPLDFEIWLNHFEHHARHPRSLQPEPASRLPTDERRRLARSMATFQLGEQSEGRGFLKAAEDFARVRDTPAIVRIVELLIREEQRHAALLLAYMQEQHIARARGNWTDRCFRRLRRLAGLEVYLQVLVSAELIGIVYYRALAAATRCPRLQLLCRVLVADEFAHVGFESQLLLSLRSTRTPRMQTLMRLAHHAFFLGTAGIVWLTHRAVLRRAGYGAIGFLRACRAQYAFYLEPVSLSPSRASVQSTRRMPAS